MPVVDASVVLKWFVEEPDSPLALTLRQAHLYREIHLAAPDLLLYEVANALLHHSRFPAHDVERALDTLYDLQLELVVPTVELVRATLSLARRYQLTFYDALYVGVAQELDMELITADRRLHHRVPQLPFVRLLHSTLDKLPE